MDIIGVAIITYNRKNSYYKLAKSLLEHSSSYNVIVTVKNQNIDYGNIEQELNYKMPLINIPQNVGVGFCKNRAIDYLLGNNCNKLFLIEDDCQIKNFDIFKRYIEVGNKYNIHHLNAKNTYSDSTHPAIKRIYSINDDLDFYSDITASFSFFTKESLVSCGKFDERFINMYEHIEHTYRLSVYGFTTPFWAFADIHNSSDYLDFTPVDSIEYKSTIDNSTEEYKKNNNIAINILLHGYKYNNYNPITLKKEYIPVEKVISYLKARQ